MKRRQEFEPVNPSRLRKATKGDLSKLQTLGKVDNLIWVVYRQARNGGVSRPGYWEFFNSEEDAIAFAEAKMKESEGTDKPFKWAVEARLQDARILNGGKRANQNGAPHKDPEKKNFARWAYGATFYTETYLKKVREALARDSNRTPEDVDGTELINYLIEVGLKVVETAPIRKSEDPDMNKRIPKLYAVRFTRVRHEELSKRIEYEGNKQNVLNQLVWNALGELGYLEE